MKYPFIFVLLLQMTFALELSFSGGFLSPQNNVKDAWQSAPLVGGSLRGKLQDDVFWEGRMAATILSAKEVTLDILHIDLQGGYLWRRENSFWPGVRAGINMVFTRGIKSEKDWLINSNESDYGAYLGMVTPKGIWQNYFIEGRGQWQVLWTLPKRSHFLQLEALIGIVW